MKNYLKNVLVIVLWMAGSGGCTPFSHLTVTAEDESKGPTAADCGSCHILQFQEWSASAHAQAFDNAAFQEALAAGGDEECLGCHAPLAIRPGTSPARAFHRDEGVTCVSCHLVQGRMHGPHQTSALIHPHPVQAGDAFYLGNDICATCHAETAAEYRAGAPAQGAPTCLSCHAAPQHRTASQGSGFFSKALVAFENEVVTRSHAIALNAMAPGTDLLDLALAGPEQTGQPGTVAIFITNTLPHNLPTGTFGGKSIELVVRFLLAGQEVAVERRVVSGHQNALAPGETTRLLFPLLGPAPQADTLDILLERHAVPPGSRPGVLLTTKKFSLPAETTR